MEIMANVKKNPLAGKKGRGKNLPKKVCCECHEEKKLSEFYQASDRTNSIDGKVPLCKACYKNMSTNEDGTINIPEVLRPYMGGKEKIYPTSKN